MRINEGAAAACEARPRWMKRMQVARIGLLVALLGVGIFEAFALRGRGVHNNDFRHVWLGAWVMAHHPTRNPYDDEMMDALAQRFGMTEPGRGINPYVYLPATGLALRPLAELNFTAPTRPNRSGSGSTSRWRGRAC
jgi:hypothetical protein